MPEQMVFRCPCCGMRAPRERLEEEGPFPLESWLQTYSGKEKLSDAERELRKGQPFRRGSGTGKISYEKLEIDEELQELFDKRIEELK